MMMLMMIASCTQNFIHHKMAAMWENKIRKKLNYM